MRSLHDSELIASQTKRAGVEHVVRISKGLDLFDQ